MVLVNALVCFHWSLGVLEIGMISAAKANGSGYHFSQMPIPSSSIVFLDYIRA